MAVVNGDQFDNVLNGVEGAERVEGYGGDDILNGVESRDVLIGGAGDDLVYGNGGRDGLIGGSGSDGLYGGTGDDTLNPGSGNDYVDGGDGIDTATWTGVPRGIFANIGDAIVLDGTNGTDIVFNVENLIGSSFDDYMRGTNADNIISGGAGSDILDGSGGNDTLDAGLGNDAIYGNDGDDTVFTSTGRVWYYGGAGADTFVLDAAAGAGTVATVLDFVPGEDHLTLRNSAGGAVPATADLLATVILTDGGSTVFTLAPENYVVVNNSTSPDLSWFA